MDMHGSDKSRIGVLRIWTREGESTKNEDCMQEPCIEEKCEVILLCTISSHYHHDRLVS